MGQPAMRIAIVSPTSLEPGCGIGDHGYRLAEALVRTDEVLLVSAPPVGRALPEGVDPGRSLLLPRPWASALAVRRFGRWLRRARPGAVLLEYAPHLDSPRGLNLWAAPFAALCRSSGRPLVVALHEIARPFALSWRAFAGGLAQRASAALLLALSRGALVGSFERVPQVRRLALGRRIPVRMVPVGSNVPVSPGGLRDRSRLRAELGLAPQGILLATFGRGHESLLADWVAEVLSRARDEGLDARLIALGGVGCRFAASDGAHLMAPGVISEIELSTWLTASDLFLLPLGDGVSTRRTTLMAALAHGLPVVATAGSNTDPRVFPGDFLALVPSSDREGFVRAALELVRDPSRRSALGEAARTASAGSFSWERLAGETSELVREAAGSPRSTGRGIIPGGHGPSQRA